MSLFRGYTWTYLARATLIGCSLEARAVLMNLMVGRPSCSVPGLFEVGRHGLAEQLRIEVSVVNAAMAELHAAGILGYGEEAIMRIPGVFDTLDASDVLLRAPRWLKHIAHNFPKSESVVKAHTEELVSVVTRIGPQSWVYFIQAGNGGPIKIGRSNSPTDRLTTLQTSHSEELVLLAVTKGGERLEKSLHMKFKQHRLRGEWFEPSPAILSEIESIWKSSQ